MKTIIAGSRGLSDYAVLEKAIESAPWEVSCVVSGVARGVDMLGERWAFENDVLLERYLADWKRYGRSAGPIRNRQMVEVADALVAVWDGKSRGTEDMISVARKKGLQVFVWRTDKIKEK